MFHTKRAALMLIAAVFRSLPLNINLGNAAKIGQEKLTFGRNGAFIGVDKRRKKKGVTEGTEILSYEEWDARLRNTARSVPEK